MEVTFGFRLHAQGGSLARVAIRPNGSLRAPLGSTAAATQSMFFNCSDDVLSVRPRAFLRIYQEDWVTGYRVTVQAHLSGLLFASIKSAGFVQKPVSGFHFLTFLASFPSRMDRFHDRRLNATTDGSC